MCACWHPRILTYLYPKVHACLLASLHLHILIPSGSYVLVGILASSYPQVHVCFLLSLHPHILRFMCVSFYPCILSSHSFLYTILIYILQTHIYINNFKKIMQFTIQQKNKAYTILEPTLKQVIVRLYLSAAYIYTYNL